jgi:hypothetical protein
MGSLGKLKPYIEGRFGGAYYWTETKLEDEDWNNDSEIAAKTNYDDFALI